MQRVQRIIVHDRTDAYVGEIDPHQLIDATSKEEVNGEHSLTITTLQQLEKTDRLLLRDGTGRWHEYVVLGIEERHTDGGAVAHEYYCVWSLQYDLSATFVNDLYGCGYNPGRASTPQPARRALECALEGTKRWQIGTITQLTESSASFYRRSGWEGLQTTVERWGGEIDATIDVSTTGVVGRYVNLLAHTGQSEATRRFDYGHDVSGIRRIVSDEIWPCRIVPLGKSVETEAGGYTRRKSIDSVNDGIPWVEDASAVPLTRVPDGEGGWEYPTLIVKNDTYEDPEELKAWAVEHVSEYCRPIVSYTADVVQFERAGMSPHGVSLGDEVVVVDRDFCEGGLRIAARVVKVEEDLLDPSQTKLTIGNAQETLGGQLGSISREVSQLTEQAGNAGEYQATAGYLSALLGRLNDEANATGGYTYITEGQGIRTYDRAVTDPLVGAEATKVVEVKGGTIRIADSRTSGGDWDWKTVFTSGHIAAELITALAVNTGYIGSTTSGAYWDIDNGIIEVKDANGNTIASFDPSGVYIRGLVELYAEIISGGSKVGASTTRQGRLDSAFNRPSPSDSYYMQYPCYGLQSVEEVYAGSTTYSYGVFITPRLPLNSAVNSGSALIGSTDNLYINSNRKTAGTDTAINLMNTGISLKSKTSGTGQYFIILSAADGISIAHDAWTIASATSTGNSNSSSSITFYSALKVWGDKNRVMRTGDYGDRLLYAYETPEPYFGDIGSGTIEDDGTAIVSIDPVFAEVSRTDIHYQVFLQACGRGELFVTEKHADWFMVEGTPGLAFDWEVKAKQHDASAKRLDDDWLEDTTAQDQADNGVPEDVYAEELAYADGIESIYAEEMAA